jgi:hypothetical protein
MTLPHARREDLIIVELRGGETPVYDLTTHRAHSLNPSVEVVWRR